METTLVTGPTSWPLTLAEAKKHLYINTANTSDDALVYALIRGATQWVEQYTKRRLVSQTTKLFLRDWPRNDYITYPYGQLQSVTHIKYKNTAGTQFTWDSGEYIVDTDSDPGRVVVGYGESYPTTALYPSLPIETQFVSGYYYGSVWAVNTAYTTEIITPTTANMNGLAYQCTVAGTTHAATEPTWPTTIGGTVADGTATWTCVGRAIPDSIRHAIKIVIADGYENRESQFIETGRALMVNKTRAIEILLAPYILFSNAYVQA